MKIIEKFTKTLPEQLEALEQDLLERALTLTDGNIAKASWVLGIRRTTMVEKMKKYGTRLFLPHLEFRKREVAINKDAQSFISIPVTKEQAAAFKDFQQDLKSVSVEGTARTGLTITFNQE